MTYNDDELFLKNITKIYEALNNMTACGVTDDINKLIYKIRQATSATHDEVLNHTYHSVEE